MTCTLTTQATRFRPFVFTRRGKWVHRVRVVELYWFRDDDDTITPTLYARAVCGASIALTAAIPHASGSAWMLDTVEGLPLCPHCLGVSWV